MKSVDKEKNPGLAKLPEKVRNKMGFMKRGGAVKKKIKKKKKRVGKMGGGMMKKRVMKRGGGMMKKRMKRGGRAK